jgi:hypothetical protein
MKTPTITSTINAQWLRRSIVALATVLSIGIIVFGLVHRTPIGVSPAPAAPPSGVRAPSGSAYAGFVEFKRGQIEQLGAPATHSPTIASAASARFIEHKLAQVAQLGASDAHSATAPTGATTRFVAHKRHQVDQLDMVLNGSIRVVPAYVRFVEHKLAQLDLIDALATRRASAPSAAYQRFIDFKHTQIGE